MQLGSLKYFKSNQSISLSTPNSEADVPQAQFYLAKLEKVFFFELENMLQESLVRSTAARSTAVPPLPRSTEIKTLTQVLV